MKKAGSHLATVAFGLLLLGCVGAGEGSIGLEQRITETSVTTTVDTPTQSNIKRSVSTASPSTTVVAPCEEWKLGLSRSAEPGPVAMCEAVSSVDPIRTAVVLPRPSVESAEGAFEALAAGLTDDEVDAGFVSPWHRWWEGAITVVRSDADTITIELPTPVNTNNLSTSTASFTVRIQMLGTAFSDPSVRRVEDITVDGVRSLCGYMEGGSGCLNVTRQEFFSELEANDG